MRHIEPDTSGNNNGIKSWWFLHTSRHTKKCEQQCHLMTMHWNCRNTKKKHLLFSSSSWFVGRLLRASIWAMQFVVHFSFIFTSIFIKCVCVCIPTRFRHIRWHCMVFGCSNFDRRGLWHWPKWKWISIFLFKWHISLNFLSSIVQTAGNWNDFDTVMETMVEYVENITSENRWYFEARKKTSFQSYFVGILWCHLVCVDYWKTCKLSQTTKNVLI